MGGSPLTLACAVLIAGCDSPFAAKLAVIRAVKTIADEAGVHIGIRKFAVRCNIVSNLHTACTWRVILSAGIFNAGTTLSLHR